MIEIFIFLFGLAIGSFLNCVIYRLETDGSFLKGRSFCPNCKHLLKWPDLIPVFSFFLLRRKCRYCQQKISWQYPLVEIATGLLFLLIFNFQFPISNSLVTFYYLLITCFLVIIFVYDLKHYIIPDKVTYPAIAIAGIFNYLSEARAIDKGGAFGDLQFSIFNYLLSALGAAAFFGAIVLISRGKWMGIGDIKLAFLMGLFLGFPNILAALFSAFLFGAIIGVGLIIAGKKTLKSEVPFGPFLVTGTFMAMFWGEKLINWYLFHLSI